MSNKITSKLCVLLSVFTVCDKTLAYDQPQLNLGPKVFWMVLHQPGLAFTSCSTFKPIVVN